MRTQDRNQPRKILPEQETSDTELLHLVQSLPTGDPRRQAACETLVTRYEHLVRSCVRRYRDSPEAADDLMQVGYVGLMKAINNFDPGVGGNLSAYAQPCVSGEIKRHFRDKRWQVRVGRPAQELRLRIRGALGELTQQLAGTPSTAEIAQYLHVSEADVAEAQLASRAFQASALDAPVLPDGTGASISDLMGAEDPGLDQAIDMDAVWQHIEELPDREQRLLMMRFYGNMTQEQIAQRLGISQMHVSRLLTRALGYLREHIGEPPPTAGRRKPPQPAASGSTATA
jgi:RNA polymerase sigma-B factor